MAHQFVGVDAHKRSVTVAVVDVVGGELAAASFANSSHGVEEVAVWLHAAAPAVLRIGVEGSSGHGRHLAQRLVAAGYDVWEVPPRRTAERRRARRAPTTDHHDSYPIARAVAGEPRLGPVKPGAGLGEAHDELVIVRDHRNLLVQRRKTMLNQAEAALDAAPLAWTDTGRAGRKVLPRLQAVLHAGQQPATAAERELLALLSELDADIAELNGRIRVLDKRLAALIIACGSSLLDEPGIGVVTAAALLAEVGDPARFRNEGAFNRWWGGAPVARSPPQKATLSPPDTASTCSATAPSTACYMSCRSPKAAITSPPATTWNVNGLKATARKKPAVPTRLCWADASSDACGPTDADNLIIQHPKLPNRIPLDKGASGTCQAAAGFSCASPLTTACDW